MSDRPHVPARVLAPVALTVVFLCLLIIVVSSGGGGNSGAKAPSQGGSSSSSSKSSGSSKSSSKKSSSSGSKSSYTVKPGDSLGSIAEKTGVPVDKLQELNPDTDPQTLNAGDKLKLR